MLAATLGGGLAWLGLGYHQHAVHQRWKSMTGVAYAALCAAEFVAATVCMSGLGALIINS